jgi:hypothetical protein
MANIDYVLVEDVTNNILERVASAKEFRTGSPPVLNGKPFKWLPYIIDAEPVYDKVTHRRLASVEVVTSTKVSLTHPIKKKTAEELLIDKQAELISLDGTLVRMVEDLMVLFAEGKEVTKASFPDIVWAKINKRRALRGQGDV